METIIIATQTTPTMLAQAPPDYQTSMVKPTPYNPMLESRNHLSPIYNKLDYVNVIL